jgi:hypothetical protein
VLARWLREIRRTNKLPENSCTPWGTVQEDTMISKITPDLLPTASYQLLRKSPSRCANVMTMCRPCCRRSSKTRRPIGVN